MNNFTIKDLENLSGVKAHTIRIWEQRYDFLKPERTSTNIRYYNGQQLKTLLNIALLNKYGFKISHINRMSPLDLQQKVLYLVTDDARQDKIIVELVQSMIDIDIESFELKINQLISANGLEKSFINIIFPFLQKIGILWTTDSINPAQEHLVTNLLRQKIIASIENLKPTIPIKKPVVLFLPENEFHELGLLFVNYLFKKRGIVTYYIGGNVPINSIEKLIAVKKPHYIYTHLTAVIKNFDTNIYLQTIGRVAHGITVIVSGRMILQVKKKMPDNVVLKYSLADVIELIDNIAVN